MGIMILMGQKGKWWKWNRLVWVSVEKAQAYEKPTFLKAIKHLLETGKNGSRRDYEEE